MAFEGRSFKEFMICCRTVSIATKSLSALGAANLPAFGFGKSALVENLAQPPEEKAVLRSIPDKGKYALLFHHLCAGRSAPLSQRDGRGSHGPNFIDERRKGVVMGRPYSFFFPFAGR